MAPAIRTPEIPTKSTEMPRWNDRVFYEVFVRRFNDSSANDIGDLDQLC